MADDQDVQIAILQEQIRGLKDQQKANAEANAKMYSDQNVLIGKLFDEVKLINFSMNRGRGAFAASMVFAGFIGSAVMAFVEYVRH